jgi:hypothetical protein
MRSALPLFALALCLTVSLGYAGNSAGNSDVPGVVRAKGSGPSAECNPNVLLMRPTEPRVFQASQAGLIHVPTKTEPTAVVCIDIPYDLSLAKLIVEWDVTPGSWNPQYAAGSHNLAWIHRGSYSGNTIGNVNVFGRGRNFIGLNQNVDMKVGAVSTGRLRNADLVTDGSRTYRLRYTYDAAAGKAFFEISGGGLAPRSTEMQATARGSALLIPQGNRWSDSSLFVELGHFGEARPSAGKPAVATYGWKYSNLRVTMIQK